MPLTYKQCFIQYQAKTDGTPATGYVEFTPNSVLLDANSSVIFNAESIRGDLDATGKVEVELLANDSDDITPDNWSWTVDEKVDGGGLWWFQLTEVMPEPVDLRSLYPLSDAPPTIVDPGTPGQAATIAVGTTLTGAPGSPADVTNSGNETHAIFDFTIPEGDEGEPGGKGDPGDKGEPGKAATIAVGTTDTGLPGTPADVVNVGTEEAAIFDFTIPEGDKGDPGNKGDPGDSSYVDAGTTTTGDAGTDASVVNSGTTSDAVFDFTIPRGDTGEAGPPPHIGDDEPVDPAVVEWFDTSEESIRGVANSGDTMTGLLILSGDAVDPLGATPLQQVAQKSMVGNLLTDDQASGTDETGTTAGFEIIANSSLASSNIYADSGTRSLLVTKSGGVSSSFNSSNSTGAPVTVGQPYTVAASARAGTGQGQWQVGIRWYDGAGDAIPGINWNGTGTVGASTFDYLSAMEVAPAGAVTAAVAVKFDDLAVGDNVYSDNFGIWAGAGGDWAMPGTPITGLGTRITRPNVDDRLVEQWNGAAWSVVDYDSGWRALEFDPLAADSGDVHVQRVNGLVSWRFRVGQALRATGDLSTGNCPLGFRPPSSGAGSWTIQNLVKYGTYDMGSLRHVTSLSPSVYGLTIGSIYLGQSQYTTPDAIPTSLPGTLVTPAPQ